MVTPLKTAMQPDLTPGTRPMVLEPEFTCHALELDCGGAAMHAEEEVSTVHSKNDYHSPLELNYVWMVIVGIEHKVGHLARITPRVARPGLNLCSDSAVTRPSWPTAPGRSERSVFKSPQTGQH